jgi:hypothetical protein
MSKRKAPPVKERLLRARCQNTSCLRETALAKWLHRRKHIDDLAADNLFAAVFPKFRWPEGSAR